MPPGNRIYHHITNRATTVVECLAGHFKTDPARAEELIALGAIYHNKLRVLENLSLPKGAYLRLHLQPKRYPTAGIDWPARIVAQTKDYLIIDKPAGIPTHATVDNVVENALEQMRRATGLELLATQRLDVPVSGLLLFATHKRFQVQFNRWLGEHAVTKIYCALTEKQPPLGLSVHYTENSERAPRKFSAEVRPGWLRCELKVRTTQAVSEPPVGAYASEVELLTGRTHQIRGQFASLGSPLWGDTMYGGRRYPREELGLRCVKLSWRGSPAFSLPVDPWARAYLVGI